jgi:20S proteasome subunit alpha 6
MEAVKQGSACVGLRSNDFAVLVALKRSSSELSSYQQKIFQVDDHCGVVGSGLAADSSVLCKFMRKECMSFRYVYNGDIPVNRLVLKVADKCQECTQNAGSRPFGVGFLVAGYDQAGPHIFQTCPSGNYFEYKAYTIGARSQVCIAALELILAHNLIVAKIFFQASKTFLEMHVDSFANMPRDTLILQGLLSLKASLQSGELDASNCTVAVVGKDQVFVISSLKFFWHRPSHRFCSLSKFLTALPCNLSSTL